MYCVCTICFSFTSPIKNVNSSSYRKRYKPSNSYLKLVSSTIFKGQGKFFLKKQRKEVIIEVDPPVPAVPTPVIRVVPRCSGHSSWDSAIMKWSIVYAFSKLLTHRINEHFLKKMFYTTKYFSSKIFNTLKTNHKWLKLLNMFILTLYFWVFQTSET